MKYNEAKKDIFWLLSSYRRLALIKKKVNNDELSNSIDKLLNNFWETFQIFASNLDIDED